MPGCMTGRRPRRWWATIGVQLATAAVAGAVPLESRQIDQQQQSNGNSPPTLGSSISPKVWVPAIVVVFVFLGAFCFVWTRTSVVSRLRGVATRAVHSSSSNGSPTTREVTASQLAGGASVSRRTGGTRNLRTGRRNRRTPSQISTTSLPVYMKEPGDQELVIFRGPETMDASDAIAEAREAEDQDDEHERDSASIRRLDSQASMLVLDPNHDPQHDEPRPDESAMSLGLSGLGDNAANDPGTSTTELLPRGHQHQRNDSRDTSDSRSLSARRMSDTPSEAPPDYDYASRLQRESMASVGIDHPPGLTDSDASLAPAEPVSDPSPSSPEPASSTPPQSPAQPTIPEHVSAQSRRSRLASRVSGFLHLRNGNGGMTAAEADAAADGPARVSDVSASTAPANNAISLNDPSLSAANPPITQQTQPRHQHSSSSTSTLPIPFRTLSRQRSSTTLARPRSSATLNSSHNPSASRSNVNLNSPSSLSLSLSLAQGTNPISSPLSHTLMRTEIQYPPSGPTPDQVKLLSSREGFGRFGVPYGEDAVAHARSSRLNLEMDPPPPVFGSPTDEGGPSAARTSEDNDDEDDPDVIPRAGNTEDSSSPSLNRSVENLTTETHIFMPLFM